MLDKRSLASGLKIRSISRMVRPERIELPTSWFVAKHSIQLSYGRLDRVVKFRVVKLYRKLNCFARRRISSRLKKFLVHGTDPLTLPIQGTPYLNDQDSR